MVRVLVVLRGGYPWGFRMQGGGDKPLIVSKVTSTGKAGGAGVRAGCAVKAINGTPTAQLSLSHAHALTKQGSTLTLEIDEWGHQTGSAYSSTGLNSSEEPRVASLSNNSLSSSTSTSSTVVAANGHISSRRRTESGSSGERGREPRPDDHSDKDKSEDSSNATVIILETYGADPDLLRSDQEEDSTDSGTDATQDFSLDPSDSSLNLSNISGTSDLDFGTTSRGSNESDEGSSTDQGSHTDTSTDTLVADDSHFQTSRTDQSEEAFVEYDRATGAFIEYPETRVTYNEQGRTSGGLEDHTGTYGTYRELDQTFGVFVEYSALKETYREKDLITGALIEYPNDNSDDERLTRTPTLEDSSFFDENGDSFFLNFEEELKQVEVQYPDLRAEHLLSNQEEEEEEIEEVPLWLYETAKEGARYSTIPEEGEEEETVVLVPPGKLEATAMGQYYSSASGGGPSGGEVSGSLASSPRSSEEWRMSMASTATVASTGTADSDDTLAKDMSELSSVNSRLSSLDEAHDEKKSPHISQSVIDPKATSKGTAQPDHKRQTSIKDAIDELESIEQAAQTLLQKRQFSTEDDRPTLVTATDTPTIHPYCASLIKVNPNEKLSPQSKRKVLPNLPEISEGITKEISAMKPDKEVHLQTTEASTSPISLVINGDSTAKGAKMESETRSEIKPPLPPAAGSHSPKQEVKRRFWSRPKELQPYISRESYNEERILKELERLRRSYQEGDLNDFLDALENTPFSDDIEEAFLRQLLVDIGEDVEGLPQEVEDSAQPQEETQVEQMEPSAKPIHEVPTESPRSSLTAGKFEKVKERIVNIITVRRAGRVIDTGNCEKTITPKDDTKTLTDSPEDSGRSETLQSISPVTPQSLIPDTTDSKSSRPQTPDVTKDDGKKSFNIADLLKKGSPKYLRKKYKERKNRKSDLMTTSESESEDPDGSKKETGYSNSTSQKKSSFTESQSSLKGSNRSLNSSQELKKEVRFDLDPDGQRKGLEESSGKDTKTEFVTPMVVDKVANHKFSGPQMITCEAQLQETIILKEFEETTEEIESDVSFTLPAMVEDINSRAETLLPRLPERVRPPRKKKRFIPAPVEELSAGDLSVGVTSPVASCGSQKGGESNTEFLVINTAAKEESPPPLPHYEELMDLPKTTPKCVEVVEKASYEDITSVAKQEFVDSTVTKGIISYTKSSQQLPYVACTTIMTQGPSAAATLSTPVTSAAPPQTNDSTFDTFEESLIVDTPLSAVESVPPTSTPADFPTTSVSTSVVDVEVLVSPLVVTTVASISVAPAPEDATLLIYPARTLPLPVIPECLQEDQMSIPTPSEPTVSFSSYGGSAPTTPYDEEEKLPSLYDNVNPFEEMLELENKLLQDDASEPSTVTSTASEPPILTSAASEPPILTSAASEPPILISTASELPTVTSTASAPPVVTSIAVEIEEETTKIETVIVSQLSKDENKSNHFGLPQEAYKSPDIEKSEVVDIDALAALTVEMFRFTQDMDKSLPREESKPVDSYTTSAPKISTAQNTCKSYIKSTLPTETASGDSATGCEVLQSSTTMPGGEVSKTKLSKTLSPKQGELNSKQTKETVTQTEPATAPRPVAVKERATSNTIAIQTDDTRYVLMSEASSQTDTEYETDLETESEMEENATNTYDASKWLFGPSRDSNLPLSTPRDPQMQELHRQQQAMILELQQQNLMQERRQKEKPEVPPRQFQEKMPLKVVNELKTVLSEVEESGPRLKKVADPPPRRDTDFSWNNDDLATIPEEVVAPSVRAVGGIDARQQPRHLADPSISSPLDKLQAPTTHLEIPAKHVKGIASVDLNSAENITTAKVRANVYPFFAPVAKIPRGKPPVPRPALRRLSGEGQALEEGYQSDPGARRFNGRHKVPAKVKPSTPTPEDRGYATDTELVMKMEQERQQTLGGRTPLSQQEATKAGLHQGTPGQGKGSVQLTPQATPVPVALPSPPSPPLPPPLSPQSAVDEQLSLGANIPSIADVDRDVAGVLSSGCRLSKEFSSTVHVCDVYRQCKLNYTEKILASPPIDVFPDRQLCDAVTHSAPVQDNCDVPMSQEQSPPPLPPPPSPTTSRCQLAPATASVDRGVAAAESPCPCQPSYAQSGSKTDVELSYRTERPRRPLTWCTQYTPAAFPHHLITAPFDHLNQLRLPGGRIRSPSRREETASASHLPPRSRPISLVEAYGSQRLQAQGLAEWLFFARLDRTNKLLSQLPSSMELKPSPHVNGSGEVNGSPTSAELPPQDSDENISREDIVKSAKYPSAELKKKLKSPPPPPRPRTPTDERDPELVYAERRYLSYFEGPPYKRRQGRSCSSEPSEPTLQQLEAQRRYNNYFLGPPRASTPTTEDPSRSPQPDEAQLAALRRYESYFHPGPPRPRPTQSPAPTEPDAQQLEAERRYLSYFNAGPPRARPPSQTEKKPEPDAEQLEAERRYLKYFNPAPPRPTHARDDRPPEPDAEQLEAERRYLAYFRPGPPRPRPRPSSMTEPSPEPDAEQLEAERRYLSYFNPGPPRPRPRSDIDVDKKPDQHQIEAEKRYMMYFQGTPKAKHKTDEEREKEQEGKLRTPPTREMLEAEERFLSYFRPIPCGEPRRIVSEPPLRQEDKVRQQLMKEYWEAIETRVDRKGKKIIRLSRPKREIQREATPPTQRELVVEEFLQRVKDRKKEKDLHYGDTDDEEEEKDGEKTLKTTLGVPPASGDDPPTPIIEGGGEVKGRIVEDLGLFVSPEALQELGLDESTLLSEIEQILGFGSLSRNRTEKPTNTTSSSSSRPDSFEKPVKLEKPNERKPGGEKPRVPERDSSKGVWSPGRSEDEGTRASGPSKIDLPDLPSFKDQPSVWSPGRGQNNTSGYNSRIHDPRPDHPSGRDPSGSASPSLGRKEYRKITYDGPITPQRRPSQEGVSTPRPEESFAWKDINVEKVARSPTSTSLPKVQNPTVTLLQKKRDDPHSTPEGQIPGKRPEYLKPDDTGPKYKPDDKLYVIKREYGSEDEEGGRRFAVLGPKKVQGVGPTTNDGVPTTLKSGVRSEHQGEWYRRMFDSLHKVKDDDHIIIKYKVPRARYGGYLSEPEGYDSDVGSSRYATLDRRRQHHFEVDPMTSSLPRNTSRYVHQPGRIEDYVPGYSSLSEKELKKNPEADVKLESHSQEPPPVSVNHRFGSQKMSMTHALKESGYESDSTLVFRKREDARRQIPDPRKTSQVYRQIQRGGDIPFTGLQKANPPRPRESPYKYESGEVNIHYRTPVRIEQKESIPEEELARRQEEHMKKVYENERRKKYLAELEDIERRRHTDNFTPLQKSPIPLNRYDDESSLGTMRGARTPDLKQVAKALYNFTAQNKRELTFNKGDVIFIRRQIDKNWYEGEFRGSVGIFPCNYIEIVPYENVKTLTRKPTEGQARARFNFQAQTSMEMSLSKGELVVLTRRVDENWYEGRIGNRKGIFPVSYVDTLVEPGSDRPMTPSSSSPMPRPALPAANLLYNGASTYSSPYSTLGRPGSQNDSRPYNQSLTVNTQQEPVAYRALYNYKPQNDDELELLESDIVMVMEKCDDGWFVGTSRRTGLFGTFPGNYVERV